MNILIIRFSALGDVILTIPVINALLQKKPNVKIWITSDIKNKSLFDFDERVHFIGADFKIKHKSIVKLTSFLNDHHRRIKFDIIYDFHDVIRSKIIRLYFKIKGVKTRKFDKGRIQKKKIIRKSIPFQKLKHTTKRYLETFEKDFEEININSFYHPRINSVNKSENIKVGIAPFAAHKSKEWPIENFIPIIKNFNTYSFIFFGYGKRELNILNKTFKGLNNFSIIDSQFNFIDQLKFINNLDAMIAMDSANMHLASLTKTQLISIWGPTHHYLGFGPLNNEKNIIEIPQSELKCRPCSIYGKINNKHKSCAQESMDKIIPEMVIKKLNEVIN